MHYNADLVGCLWQVHMMLSNDTYGCVLCSLSAHCHECTRS
jgi:hypothetical protein